MPLLDIPPDYFAVQLIAVSDRETLEAYALENGLIGLSATRVRSGKAIFYVLILGVYETKDKAELAVASLSGSMRSLKPLDPHCRLTTGSNISRQRYQPITFAHN